MLHNCPHICVVAISSEYLCTVLIVCLCVCVCNRECVCFLFWSNNGMFCFGTWTTLTKISHLESIEYVYFFENACFLEVAE